MTTPTIDEQIAEVKREIALRNVVYPKFIESKRLKPETAKRQIDNMIAALHTLMRVKEETGIADTVAKALDQ